MDIDRRKQERITVNFDVSIMLGEKIIQVKTMNISLTGILCTFHPLFQKDTPCKVIISFHDDKRMTIDSKILRVGEQGTAISFSTLDEESFVQLMWCSTRTVTKTAVKEAPSIIPSAKGALAVHYPL